jgi:hypothetical protein
VTSTVAVDDQRLSHRKMFGRVSDWLPLVVACATFFLIIAGALVTSHYAGWQRLIGRRARFCDNHNPHVAIV